MQTVEDSLLSKKIVLVGYDSECREFYYACHHRLNIQGYINLSGVSFFTYHYDQPFTNNKNRLDLEKTHLSEIDFEQYYIVLCNGYSGRNYREEKKQFDEYFYLNSLEYETHYIDAVVVYQLPFMQTAMNEFADNELLIFGCGAYGQALYKLFGKKYHICGFLSNNENDVQCLGLPVYRVTEENIAHRKILICSNVYTYRVEMMQQLEELGMIGMRDYVTNKMLVGKIYVAVGTCHVIVNADFLELRDNFVVQYSLISYLFTVQDRALNAYSDAKLRKLVKYCDVVYCLSTVPGGGIYPDYATYIKRQKLGCKVIRIANYIFRGLHPQATVFEGHQLNPYCVRLNIFMSYQVVWIYGDSNINGLIEEGISDRQILSKLKDESYYRVTEVKRNLEDALGMVRLFDKFSDIKLGDFIEQHYKTAMLFRDPSHYTTFLMLEISRQLLELLEVDDDLDETVIDGMVSEDVAGGTYLPVYPSVEKALGLNLKEFSDGWKITRIDGESIKVSYDEWILRYCNYVHAINAAHENDAI